MGKSDIWETKNFSDGDPSILAGVGICTAIVLAIAFTIIFVYFTLKKLGIVRSTRQKLQSRQQTYEAAEEEVKIDLKAADA